MNLLRSLRTLEIRVRKLSFGLFASSLALSFLLLTFSCSGDWQNKQVLGVKWNWGPRMGKHEREKRELTLITFNYSRGNKGRRIAVGNRMTCWLSKFAFPGLMWKSQMQRNGSHPVAYKNRTMPFQMPQKSGQIGNLFPDTESVLMFVILRNGSILHRSIRRFGVDWSRSFA